MTETVRGCGWRVIGGLYLCGDGWAVECDRLPLIIEACPTCGNENIAVVRAPRKVDAGKLFGGEHVKGWEHGRRVEGYTGSLDKCPEETCAACRPTLAKSAFILGVGKRDYAPNAFIVEAAKLGVSKAIPAIPNDLVLGESWVFLTHPEAGVKEVDKHDFKNGVQVTAHLVKCRQCETTWSAFDPEPVAKCKRKVPAIFYAFKPRRVEMLIWKSEATAEYIEKLEKRGITPIIVEETEENRKRHSPEGKRKHPHIKLPEADKALDEFKAEG